MEPRLRPKTAKDRLILAVDTSNLEEARQIKDELSEYVGVFKIGLELFMNEGPAALSLFQKDGLQVFLDGKFLDIPNTVAKATAAVVKPGVAMFTVHATGGKAMLEACARSCRVAAEKHGMNPPISLGVTVLTSLSQQALAEELNVSRALPDQVLSLAKMCQDSGITGIVASAEEAKKLRTALGTDFVLVTPGVRPSWADANDQSRIVTPAQAITDGADYIVIGRPIVAAADRKLATQRILAEMEEALTAV